ncbi:transmembrane protein 62-like isoform X2 [Tachypleus tridentatus]|uniref:transmembrane protein 62-like isoform X2 n=1 Tax=Tachypleus tridentatus TaxID=6853 RepID=UPI003FD53066
MITSMLFLLIVNQIISAQGQFHPRSYNFTLKHDTECYTFIGLDACLEPGPKRPFNFVGRLTEVEYKALEEMKKKSQGSNFTIWFGHYPTSTMVSPPPGVRELMKGSGPYLCGHLHTLIGLVPSMYTLHSTGSLELELSDWKLNRRYRVAAVDHGMFSFIDLKHGQWPVVLVTNPKHALYTMPSIEPLNIIRKSSHIRILIFSPYPIVSTQIQVDKGDWQNLTHSDGPLYILPWKPENYLKDIHSIDVYVKDNKNQEAHVNHVFSLDGSRPSFSKLGRAVLMGHISVGQTIFGIFLTLSVVPLCMLKFLQIWKKGSIGKKLFKDKCCKRILFKLYLLVYVDQLFWPLISMGIYSGVGPWFFGEIIDGYVGVCFVWGMFVDGVFLPGASTFYVGSLYLLTFYMPYTLILSNCLYRHYLNVQNGGAEPCTFWNYMSRHLCMIIIITWQSVVAVGYAMAYGVIAFFFRNVKHWQCSAGCGTVEASHHLTRF